MIDNEKQKAFNSIPGLGIFGLSTPSLPISNYTGTWYEAKKQNTVWEYIGKPPNGVIYSR